MSKLKSIPVPSLRIVHAVGFTKSTAKISTISSIVGGIQVLELIKFLQGKPVEQMRAYSIDLSCSLWKTSSPPPPHITVNPPEVPERFQRFSEWDCVEIRGQPDMTVRQLQEFLVPLSLIPFLEIFVLIAILLKGLTVTSLSAAHFLLYNTFIPGKAASFEER